MKPIQIQLAQYIGEYTIKFVFTDDVIKVIDFAPLVLNSKSAYVLPYKNKNKFSKFKITNSDIYWNDHNMCFTAYQLYRGIRTLSLIEGVTTTATVR